MKLLRLFSGFGVNYIEKISYCTIENLYNQTKKIFVQISLKNNLIPDVRVSSRFKFHDTRL